MFEIRRYAPEYSAAWNSFVARSKNGTFLFDRRYMDYHADRFCDYSLMIYRKNRIFALLPANEQGNVLHSHQGLTYGGLLLDGKATTGEVCELFRLLNNYLRERGFNRIVYKAIPYIYHQQPAQEDLYALTNVCQARIVARHISSTIVMNKRQKFAESRRSGLRKALNNGITARESGDLNTFWTILSNNLHRKYGSVPVHSAEEMELLKSRFPDNIKLFMAYQGDIALGGALLYVTPQVVHTQYISASPEGKNAGALDLLFNYLLNDVYTDYHYFDFGKSSNGDGHELNAPLIFQKEGFGGRGVCYDWYEWDLLTDNPPQNDNQR
ncbi:MAG: GNAT family N-acetyltransferase [Prevotella sp.]|nr:GNAT family N-acetyltransferase [Prevotella sp.]